jgi:cytoskeletal protein RodZ
VKDEPRDASLEQVLGPAFRSSLREGSDACPDAETLAAWSEDGLLPPHRGQIETHLAECARCQAHVAALARSERFTEPTPVRESRWLSWRWLVPAAAGATALALWVAIQPDSLRTEQKEAPAAATVESPAPARPPERQIDSGGSARNNAAVASPSAAKTAHTSQAHARTRAQAPVEAPSAAAPKVLAEHPTRDQIQAKSAEGAVAATPPSPRIQASTSAVDAVAAIEIVSSDPSIRWRIRGAEVEHSIDAGATWTKQATGTTVRLTAGASPSAGVCWLVGQRGTVLRSSDGRTWQTVPFLEAIDLVRVEAIGPAEATVTTADGRQFTTADGGKTWTLVRGLQEF